MKTKNLVTTAMLLAFATVLSLVQIFALPFGGSITLVSMLPVVLIGYMYGIKWGIMSAFIYSLLQMMTGFGTVSAFFLPGESQMALPSAILICIIDYMDGGKVCGEVQLQIAGIMSEEPLIEVNEKLEAAKESAFALGVSRDIDPFMTLSFMALPVIPTLRLTTRGVIDVVTQRYI